MHPGSPRQQQQELRPLKALSPTDDDMYENADENQLLTSDSQQDTPTHMANRMMVTPAVSSAIQFSHTHQPMNSLFEHFHLLLMLIVRKYRKHFRRKKSQCVWNCVLFFSFIDVITRCCILD